MELHQLSNTPDEDAVAELLTLTCEIDQFGTKRYRNKEGKLHRIHGPAMVKKFGSKFWFKNGEYHREDGPAVTWSTGHAYYCINGEYLSKEQFIQWQQKNGIKPIK